MDIHFDTAMEHKTQFRMPNSWLEMISVCELLSAEFKYVRIDLYLIKERVVVGELTFFPLAGLYPGDGQRKLSQYLDFDRKSIRPCYLTKRVNEHSE